MKNNSKQVGGLYLVGAAELYEAAVQLKSLIRGRACLLITDRTDIANAAEADGVALSPKGMHQHLQ